ncbi:hypothetical protein ACM0L0_01955 [Mycoplasma sp. 005V]|uniref:hypothetical protein n=1 Tax=Mycoplasma sp. 005V TaxID=3398776 RepID=UPI003A8BC7CC
MKKKILVSILMAGSLIGIAAPSALISASTEANVAGDNLEQQKQELINYLEGLKFKFGVGGFRNRDIPELTEKINSANSVQELQSVKETIDTFYGYLVKYYNAEQGYAFGDPYLFKGIDTLNSTHYNGGVWGNLDDMYSRTALNNSYTDMVRYFIKFYYPDSTDRIWWGAGEKQFIDKFKQYKKDADNALRNTPMWSRWWGDKSYQSLITPIKNVNTQMDTPSMDLDNITYTHIGPITVFFTAIAAPHGNVGGGGGDTNASPASRDRLIRGVKEYKKLFQKILDNVNSLDDYQNSDFYKNLNNNDQRNRLADVIGYYKWMINMNKNITTLSTGIHKLLGYTSGQVPNLVSDLFGLDNLSQSERQSNPELPTMSKVREVYNKFQVTANDARVNFDRARNHTQPEALDTVRDLVSSDVYSQLESEINAKTNFTDITANADKIKAFATKVSEIKRELDAYNSRKQDKNYLKADPELKQAYDQAVSAFENAFLDQEGKAKVAQINEEQLAQLKQEVQRAYDALNGTTLETEALGKLENNPEDIISTQAIETIRNNINTNDANHDVLTNVINDYDNYLQNAQNVLDKLNAISTDPEARNLEKLIPNPEQRAKVQKALQDARAITNEGKITSDNFATVNSAADALEEASRIIEDNRWRRNDEEEKLYQQLLAKKNLVQSIIDTEDKSSMVPNNLEALRKLNNDFDNKVYKADKAKMQEMLEEYNKALEKAKAEAIKPFNDKLQATELPETVKTKVNEEFNKFTFEGANNLQNELNKANELNSTYKAAKAYKEQLEAKLNTADYKLASSNLQEAYKAEIEKVNNFINNFNNDSTEEQLNTLKQSADAAFKNLDGDVKNQEITNAIKGLNLSQSVKSELTTKQNALENRTQADELLAQIAELKSYQTQINALENLTPEQKQQEISKLRTRSQISTVKEAFEESKLLDKSMKTLRDVLHDYESIDKNSPAYKYADEAIKSQLSIEAYAAGVILDTPGGVHYRAFNSVAENIKYFISELNGETKLVTYKSEAKRELLNNNSGDNALSEKQINDIDSILEPLKSKEEVDAIKNKAKELQAALAEAKKYQKEQNSAKTGNNYILSEKDKKDTFDSKLDELTKAITEVQNAPIPNANAIDELISKLKTAQANLKQAADALDGDSTLDQKKQSVRDAIDKAQNLSQEYKDALKQQVNDATSIEQLNNIATKANTLNQKAGELAELEQKINEAIANPMHPALTSGTAQKLQEAKAKAEELLKNALLKNNVEESTLNQAIEAATEAKNSSDREYMILDALKATAKSLINNSENLSTSQKAALVEKLQKATSYQDITAVQDQANELNQAMGELLSSAQKAKETKNTKNYSLADQEPKANFDQLTTPEALQALEKENVTTLDVNEIKSKSGALKGAIAALNGDANLTKAKATELNNLSQDQKAALTNALESANNLDELNKTAQNAKKLDTAIEQLNQQANNANTTAKGDNYLKASQDKKQAFDQAKNGIDTLVADLKAKTDFNNLDDKLAQVTTAATALETATNQLDGLANITADREAIKAKIDQLATLSPAVKDIYKAQVDKLNDKQAMEQVLNMATELNTAAKELLDQITPVNTILTSKKANYITPANKAQLDEVVAQINAKIQDNLLTSDSTAQALNELKAQLQNALTPAQQDIAQMESAIAEAIKQVQALSELSEEQKTAAINKIQAATTLAQVNANVNDAKDLNSAIAQLKQSIKQANELMPNAQQYKYATPNKANDFASALTQANKTQNDLNKYSAEQIKSMTAQLNNALQALDGTNNFNQVVNNVKTNLNSLTPEIKAQLVEQLNSAQNFAQLQELNTQFTSLNTQAGNLVTINKQIKDAFNTDTMQKNISPEAKEKVKAALSDANNALAQDQTLVNISNQNEVEKLIKELQDALQAAKDSIKENSPYWWWIAVLVLSVITFISGLGLYISKK